VLLGAVFVLPKCPIHNSIHEHNLASNKSWRFLLYVSKLVCL